MKRGQKREEESNRQARSVLDNLFVPDMSYHSEIVRQQVDQPARDRQEQLDRIEAKLDTLLQQTKSRTTG